MKKGKPALGTYNCLWKVLYFIVILPKFSDKYNDNRKEKIEGEECVQGPGLKMGKNVFNIFIIERNFIKFKISCVLKIEKLKIYEKSVNFSNCWDK
jgi:hypothetical protein